MTATKRSKVTKSKSEMVSAASKTKKMLKPVKTDDILESASRIIQQHGKDKKSESP